MPKINPLFPWERTSNGMVQVHSGAYGKHHRAKRGTHKPADVNDSFKAASEVLLNGSGPAKLIKDAIDPFRKSIKDGSLWSRLLSHFYEQIKLKKPIDFKSLEGFALHKDRFLTNVMLFKMEVTCDPATSTLHIRLRDIHFKFSKAIRGVNSALITAVVLFIDEYNESVDARGAERVIMDLKTKEAQFDIPVPVNTGTILICVKCEGAKQGKPNGNLRSKGMNIVKAVSLQGIDDCQAFHSGLLGWKQPVLKPLKRHV